MVKVGPSYFLVVIVFVFYLKYVKKQKYLDTYIE